jgi:hypothetical protein
MGNRNLRRLLVAGAPAVSFHRKPHTYPSRMWAKKLIERKPFKLVAVALANKMAHRLRDPAAKTVYRENYGVACVGRIRGPRLTKEPRRHKNRG